MKWHAARPGEVKESQPERDLEHLFEHKNLNESLYSFIDADINEPCNENNTKYFLLKVYMTEEIHTLLNGVVFALGFTDSSTVPDCFSFPLATYTMNQSSKLNIYNN